MAFFETQRLTKAFGGLIAVSDLSFRVEKGEIFGLIGPNGSGKTTVFNLINGYYPITSGNINFDGTKLNGLPTWRICKLGIGRTFQIVKPLRRMTVMENVIASAFNITSRMGEAREKAMEVMDFCELSKKRDYPAKGLSIGDRKRLEIARALATNPKLLLLDETMAGLTPQEQVQGTGLIRKIRESGVTIIIVEHIMHVIMNICDRILCINYGQEIAKGSPQEVANNKAVIEAYLERNKGVLRVEQVNAGYGDIQVLWDVSFHVADKEFVVLVGANGAGKSTIMRTISSIIHPTKGKIWFEDQRLDLVPPYRITDVGIAHVPEGRQLFPEMTVQENLELGSLSSRAKPHRKETLEWVFGLFPRLRERQKQLAGTMSGGEQQMCAIARGLMSRPKMMLFDEPSLGLSPLLTQEIFRLAQRIHKEGVTILMVEQNVKQTLAICDRAYVLENGRIVLEGKGRELLEDEKVKQAFLGI